MSQWHVDGKDDKHFVGDRPDCKKSDVQKERPRIRKPANRWPGAQLWERLLMS